MLIYIPTELVYMNNICILLMSYYYVASRHIEGLIFGNDSDHGMRMVDGYGKIDIFGNSFCTVESNSRRDRAKER